MRCSSVLSRLSSTTVPWTLCNGTHTLGTILSLQAVKVPSFGTPTSRSALCTAHPHPPCRSLTVHSQLYVRGSMTTLGPHGWTVPMAEMCPSRPRRTRAQQPRVNMPPRHRVRNDNNHGRVPVHSVRRCFIMLAIGAWLVLIAVGPARAVGSACVCSPSPVVCITRVLIQRTGG